MCSKSAPMKTRPGTLVDVPISINQDLSFLLPSGTPISLNSLIMASPRWASIRTSLVSLIFFPDSITSLTYSSGAKSFEGVSHPPPASAEFPLLIESLLASTTLHPIRAAFKDAIIPAAPLPTTSTSVLTSFNPITYALRGEIKGPIAKWMGPFPLIPGEMN